MGEDFWRLVGAVKIGVVPGYGIGHVTLVRIDIHPQNRSGEVTATVNLIYYIYSIKCYTNAGTLIRLVDVIAVLT